MKKNIIIISENQWNTPLKYQRHHIAEYFAKQEDVKNVFYCSKSAIRKVCLKDFFRIFYSKLFKSKDTRQTRIKNDKIILLDYFLFPFQKTLAVFNYFLSKRLITKLGKLNLDWNNTIVISYQPIPELFVINNKFKPIEIIYISIHDYSVMYGVSNKVAIIEQKIIKMVDLFTTDSLPLFDKLQGGNRIISLAPACPFSVVEKSLEGNFKTVSLTNFIYFGTIASYLDLDLLGKLSKSGYNIDFLGSAYDVNVKSISGLENSKLYSPLDFEFASDILVKSDAIILPYKLNSRNDLVIPAKIYECFALGLPVFVPNMKWTEDKILSKLLFIYKDEKDLLHMIKDFDYSYFKNTIRPQMLNLAFNNTWDIRFDKLYSWMKNRANV